MTISGIFVFDHVELIELRMQEQFGVIENAAVFDVGRVGCFLNPCDVIKMTQLLYENGIDMPTRISINTDRGLVYTEELNRKYFNDTLVG